MRENEKKVKHIMKNQYDIKPIALYLPQFHQIPENDRWWGDGFTDWQNVKKAEPLFPDHYQPRIPKNKNYYDLSKLDILKWQAEVAEAHGIYGFCHYHYWFEGKQLLETPTNILMAHKEIETHFCLAWANATWSRAWDIDERPDNVLQLQAHDPDPEKWENHFNYLFRAWSDPRAIKIDGKPIFLIYRPQIIDNLKEMLAFWQDRALSRGLKGLFFIAMVQYETFANSYIGHFDAVMLFQPAVAMYVPGKKDPLFSKVRMAKYLRGTPASIRTWLKQLNKRMPKKPRFHDYDRLWRKIIEEEHNFSKTVLPGAFIDWDNTARYGKRARIIRGATPDRFQYWFEKLAKKTTVLPEDRRLIFINAWNEWAEGAYLEADEKWGNGYLKAVKSTLDKF